MQRSNWLKVLAVEGIALLLIGTCGCDPGPVCVLWKADASPNPPLHAEAKK